MSRLARQIERIRSEGLATSLKYYLGTVLLAKLHCQVLFVMRAPPTSAAPEDVAACRLVRGPEEVGASDHAALRDYGGDALLGVFTRRFAQGDQAVCVYVEGALASVVWLHATDRYRLGGVRQVVVQNGFTLPQWRGRGLFRQALVFARSWSWEQGPGARADLFGEVSASNTSSINGLRKAGFEKVGWCLHAFGRSRYWLQNDRT